MTARETAMREHLESALAENETLRALIHDLRSENNKLRSRSSGTPGARAAQAINTPDPTKGTP